MVLGLECSSTRVYLSYVNGGGGSGESLDTGQVAQLHVGMLTRLTVDI